MARQIVETLIDDLDGGEAAETVTFGLDGKQYEIDLNTKNAAALRKALDRYIGGARRSGSGRSALPTRGRASAAPSRGYDIAQLREWAGKKKIALPSRGRIPGAVVEQYKADGGR